MKLGKDRGKNIVRKLDKSIKGCAFSHAAPLQDVKEKERQRWLLEHRRFGSTATSYLICNNAVVQSYYYRRAAAWTIASIFYYEE